MTRVKICGLTNLEDALCALRAGADMLGFVFYEPSPRYIPPSRARDIVRALRSEVQSSEFRVQSSKFVGVFVDERPENVRQTLEYCGLDMAQLHGEEPFDWLAQLGGRAFKAIRPPSAEAAESQVRRFAAPPAPCLLLDACHPTLRGGTGRTADWSLAARLARRYPLLLAGGLTPDNVALAVRQVEPWGVDVSSGVEAFKGKKDPAKVKAFVEAVAGG